MAKRKKRNVPAKKKSGKAGKAVAIAVAALLLASAAVGAGIAVYRYVNPVEPPAQEQPGDETPGEGTETPDPEEPGEGGEGTETPVEPDVPAIEYDTEYALWNLPASDGYTLQDGKLTFLGTQELVFTTKAMYNSVTLSFTIDSVADVRGSFQIGWGAQTTDASINVLPYVQFNYDRAVLCLPDGTTYDTSWETGDNWRLTIDAENNKVILMVGETVVYNVESSWWTQEGWGLPGYIVLRAESPCARTLDKMHIQAS